MALLERAGLSVSKLEALGLWAYDRFAKLLLTGRYGILKLYFMCDWSPLLYCLLLYSSWLRFCNLSIMSSAFLSRRVLNDLHESRPPALLLNVFYRSTELGDGLAGLLSCFGPGFGSDFCGKTLSSVWDWPTSLLWMPPKRLFYVVSNDCIATDFGIE